MLKGEEMKPYYSDKWVTIYHGDCREILPVFQVLTNMHHGKAMDLVWTDPPYNVGKDYGVWNDSMADDKYLKFCKEWIKQCKQVAKEIAIYTPTKYLLDYWEMLGHEFHQIILTWTPEGAYRNGFVNQFASILTDAKPKQRVKDTWSGLQMRGMGYFFKENDYGHPGYTSEAITCKVLTSFGDNGGFILDPFLGSGTTCYCAKKLNRISVGVEIEEKYCEIAAKRCSQMVMEF